ncbi:MAG: hypothetical protein QM758_29450 [Armatimonas sp.]
MHKEEIVLPAVEATLPEALVRRHRAAPVKPTRFEMKDPATGKTISPNTVLTLPDGQKITARDYYAMLNGLEQRSSARGYSLTARAPAPPEGVAMDTAELEKQAAKIASSFVRRSRDHAIPAGTSVEDMKARHEAAVASDAARLEALKSNHTLTERRVNLQIPPKIFDFLLGKPELLAAMATGKFDMTTLTTAQPGTMRLVGDLAIGASILKRPADFLKIGLELLAPPQGQMTARVAVRVAGKEVMAFNEVSDKPMAREVGGSTTFRMPVKFKIGMGPIGFSVEAAAVGEAGTGMFAAVRSAATDVKLTPKVNSRLEVAAKADFKIIGASVKSNVVIADGKLNVEGGSQMALQGNTLVPRKSLSGDSMLEMLAGTAMIEGFIYQPAFAIPPFKKKKFDFTLWDWKGMKVAGRLFE